MFSSKNIPYSIGPFNACVTLTHGWKFEKVAIHSNNNIHVHFLLKIKQIKQIQRESPDLSNR